MDPSYNVPPNSIGLVNPYWASVSITIYYNTAGARPLAGLPALPTAVVPLTASGGDYLFFGLNPGAR